MDEASLQEIAKPLMFFSPELAKVVGYLHDQGAAAIGVDISSAERRRRRWSTCCRAGPATRERWARRWGEPATSSCRNGSWRRTTAAPALRMVRVALRSPLGRPGVRRSFARPDSCLRRQRVAHVGTTRAASMPNMALALLIKARGLSQEWLVGAGTVARRRRRSRWTPSGCCRSTTSARRERIRTVPFRDVLAAASRRVTCTMITRCVKRTGRPSHPAPFTHPTKTPSC